MKMLHHLLQGIYDENMRNVIICHKVWNTGCQK